MGEPRPLDRADGGAIRTLRRTLTPAYVVNWTSAGVTVRLSPLTRLNRRDRPKSRVEPDEVDERSTSKSSVSRRYVAMTTKQMTKWLTLPLGDRHFPIVMIDGINLGDHMVRRYGVCCEES